MRNRNNTRFYNLGLSATSTETIRLQLELSKYLFYFVTEEVDCPGHVSEKLWLPLLRGSIPVYFGTKTVDEFLPCPKKDCVLSVKDYGSVDDLVARMREIASDPKVYASLTAWRHNVRRSGREIRDGVARASLDIQAVMCDIMRNGDDARRRGSVSNFAGAVPHSAPWLLGTYPNKNMDMTALDDIERSGRVSDVYCLRQDHVRALGEIFARDDPDVRESGRAPALHRPNVSSCARATTTPARAAASSATTDASPPRREHRFRRAQTIDKYIDHTRTRHTEPSPIESSRVARVARRRGARAPHPSHRSRLTVYPPSLACTSPTIESRLKNTGTPAPSTSPTHPTRLASVIVLPRARVSTPHTSASRARDLHPSCSPKPFPRPRSPLARAPRASRSSPPPRRDRRRAHRLPRDAPWSSPRDAGTRTRTASSPRSFASLAT